MIWDTMFYIRDELKCPFAICTLCSHMTLCQQMAMQTMMHAIKVFFVDADIRVIKMLQLFTYVSCFKNPFLFLAFSKSDFIIFSIASKCPLIKISTIYSTHRFICCTSVSIPKSRMNIFRPTLSLFCKSTSQYYFFHQPLCQPAHRPHHDHLCYFLQDHF